MDRVSTKSTRPRKCVFRNKEGAIDEWLERIARRAAELSTGVGMDSSVPTSVRIQAYISFFRSITRLQMAKGACSALLRLMC